MTDPNTPIGATPNDVPTDTLRDARLAHALRHMPDAHMQPSAQTRSAVLQEAMRAVGSATPAQPAQLLAVQRRWWHAWLGQPGHRVPWAAAVASVAVFGFITVMWYGQEVPDAAPERSPVAMHKDAAKTESAAPAAAGIAAEPSAKKAAEPHARLDARVKASRTAAATPSVPEHPLAKTAPTSAAHVATPAAPAMADSVADAVAPAAPARLERRSKAMPAEPAAADHAQARETAAPIWQLTIGNAKRTIHPEQAQSLLAQLRGLVYGAVSAPSQPSDRLADAIRLELAGQESWVITPGHVTHYLAASAGAGAGAAANAQGVAQANADTPQRSSITPAQYAALRRLAMELGAQP